MILLFGAPLLVQAKAPPLSPNEKYDLLVENVLLLSAFVASMVPSHIVTNHPVAQSFIDFDCF